MHNAPHSSALDPSYLATYSNTYTNTRVSHTVNLSHSSIKETVFESSLGVIYAYVEDLKTNRPVSLLLVLGCKQPVVPWKKLHSIINESQQNVTMKTLGTNAALRHHATPR